MNNNDELTISGAITGAITDIYSNRANEHAWKYYEFIRSIDTDIKKIAANTDFSEEQIILVKNYLFYDKHYIVSGYERFEPSFPIAESWRRLAFDKDNIKPHDITLIKHELLEMRLVSEGISQDEAHDLTENQFNYQKESDEFYEKLKMKKKDDINSNENNDDQNMVSGGIKRRIFTH